MSTKPKILIGMPSYPEYIHWMTVTSLLTLKSPYPVGFKVIPRTRIDKARNQLVMAALKQGYDYLFFMDDDNPIPSDTLVKLVEDDKDIITAPILTRRAKQGEEHQLCAYYGKEYDGVRIYSHIKQFRDDGYLHRIDACGMGCTLIKAKVLKKLYKKYNEGIFAFTETICKKPLKVGNKLYKKRTMSEDFEFSERAVDAGFKIWLDVRVRPVHLGEITYIQWSEDK